MRKWATRASAVEQRGAGSDIVGAVHTRILVPFLASLAIASGGCGGGDAVARSVVVPLPPPTRSTLAPAPPAPARTACPAGMAALPGGGFPMNRGGDRVDSVTVQPFCLDVTEVTADAYASCVRGGACSADHTGQLTNDGKTFAADPQCNLGMHGRGNHPMNCVDWSQASAYCRAQGKRLPTEEEWEWAARGGAEGRTYPWGNDAPTDQLCWSGGELHDGTCAVGSFPEGDAPGGIHDLAGNVWEWTSSDFVFNRSARAMRGGSWSVTEPFVLGADAPSEELPGNRHDGLGFRCAQ